MSADPQNGETIYMTVSQTAGAAFVIQALSAFDRRMLHAGRPLGRRRVIIVLLAVAALLIRSLASLLSYVGVASALFGSHGAIKLWMQRNQGNHSHHDDSDE